ncbi:MAG: hypothetical protein QME58_12495 [Bacteroidota bacterium]|nr:hypothetical protein [Bacteroidota bacterium]
MIESTGCPEKINRYSCQKEKELHERQIKNLLIVQIPKNEIINGVIISKN